MINTAALEAQIENRNEFLNGVSFEIKRVEKLLQGGSFDSCAITTDDATLVWCSKEKRLMFEGFRSLRPLIECKVDERIGAMAMLKELVNKLEGERE